MLQTQAQGAATIGFTIGHNPAHPFQAQGETFLNSDRGFHAITPIAIPHAETQGEATIAAAPQTQ
jgi:hypothetical protein